MMRSTHRKLCNFAQMCATAHQTNNGMNASSSPHIYGSSVAAQTLVSKASLVPSGTSYLSGLVETGGVHLRSINITLSEEGAGLLLAATQEWRSVCD